MGKDLTCKHFAAELIAIRLALIEMGGMVELMIFNSASALTDRNCQLAERAIASDADINRLELEVDRRCFQLLARHQPLACDLRFITMALKTVTDLERMGDHCVSIGREALELNREAPLTVYQDVRPMAEAAGTLVKDALDAFVSEDGNLASRVLTGDRTIHQMSLQLQRELVGIMQQHPANISRAVRLESVTRHFERIANHATNIAEMVIFMMQGKDVRHPRQTKAGVVGKSSRSLLPPQRQLFTLPLQKRAAAMAVRHRSERRSRHST